MLSKNILKFNVRSSLKALGLAGLYDLSLEKSLSANP